MPRWYLSWHRGQREVDLLVVLEGTVDVYSQNDDGKREVIATLQAGKFSGELDLIRA